MTKEELKEQFSVECTEIDKKGRIVVKGTPMDIINWVADKFCLSHVSNSLCETKCKTCGHAFTDDVCCADCIDKKTD